MGKSYADLRNPDVDIGPGDVDIGPGDADVRENNREKTRHNCAKKSFYREETKNNREGKVCPSAIRFDFGAIRFDFVAIRFQLYAMDFQVYAIRECLVLNVPPEALHWPCSRRTGIIYRER